MHSHHSRRIQTDGWSTGPDGLQNPGPNYNTNLTGGFPFGALLGRIGATGPRWLAGAHCRKSGLEAGRLYLAINDNPHWQNNVGSFRVRLRVTDSTGLESDAVTHTLNVP